MDRIELRPGPLALVGSGEYTPAMNDTDGWLLELLGRRPARVALLATASALEPGMPDRWNAMGMAHWSALGAQPAALPLLTRADAADAQIVDALNEADLFYFSGGDPQHLAETLRDTPAWDVIRSRHAAGAALAGCSAGAMMLGGYTLGIRALIAGQPPSWPTALGFLPNLAILPHFDRAAEYMGEELLRAVLAAAPAGVTLLGIDEDTALVRAGERWVVSGRQSVVVFVGDTRRSYQAGEQISLPPP
ncbi:MAG TPA: Type 1 glutamine amidotransferase-like domain-containing protein [Roseiflexaceae bacterium]|nr:Type 1 glutamine amidotransferase-like domain-containing protein [Roseiflexaceae bacterium]